MWEHTTGMSSTPSLTPRARAWFKTQALQLATDALARPLPDGTPRGWVEVSALTDQLFSTNKAYGAALVTAWMTTHNIPTSGQEKNLKLTREAVNAAFTGNTNYGTIAGKPQPFAIAKHVYGLNQKATDHEEKQTQGRVQYQVVAHGATELKNTLQPGVEAKVNAVVQLARKAILTNQNVTITDASGPFRSGTTANQPGTKTKPDTHVERRVRGILQAARLYHLKEDTPYVRPGMEWSGLVHDTLTAASTHLDVNPNSDNAALIGAATAQIVADTGLSDPADPAAATHLTALLTGALEGAGLTTPTLANHPNSYLGVQLNAVLTYAKDHGPLTDQDIKVLAQQEFATITTTLTTPADLAAFTWQVRGWLHGAGLHGAPHPEQPPHPLATRAAHLADQLTARNLPYTPAQIAAGLFPHLPAVTDHHRDLTATWIDQYTQSHTPPTNTTPSTLDTTGRQIPVRANKITWKRDQPQSTTSTATAASSATASTSSTATTGATGVTAGAAGMPASNIGAWPSAATPNIDPVTGLTPGQQAALTQLALQTTPALPGASTDTFYTALLTATPEQLRNATTSGEIRRHLATQAVLDFHTDPTMAARITHAGGLDTVLTHLRDGTEATTGTGALVPDLAARYYEFPIDIIDANGDVMPGAGRPRQVTANTVNSTTVTLTHTRKPQNTNTTGASTGGSGTTGGSYDHFLPTTANDHLNAFLAPDSSSTGRNRRRREASRDPSEERDRRGWAPRDGGWSDTLFGSVPVADTTANPAAGKNPAQNTILNENIPTPARTSPTISTPAVTTPTNDAADGDPRRSSIREALAGPTTPATTATTPATSDTTPATATTPAAAPAATAAAAAVMLGVGVVAAATPDAVRRVGQRFPWLKTVNPFYKSGTRYTRAEFETNCVLAAITVDISIAEGEGFAAPPSAATTIDELINNTGNRPVPTTYRDVAAHLLASPPGTRGYLAIETKPGTGRRTVDGQTVDGHVVNVIHAVDGNVYFLDGQTGGPAHLPEHPTKVEYIPTTTTDTLATPAAAAAPPSTPPSPPAPAPGPVPGPVLSAGSESAPVIGPARGDVLFGQSRMPITRGVGGAAVTVDDARFGEEKERSEDPGGSSNTMTGLTADSNGMGKGKEPVGVGDLSTAHTTGDDQIGRVETAEPGRLEERFRAEFGRHVDVQNLLKDASDLLPRIPMVIPDHSPELTAAYRAVQDAKFEVAKLLHAGKDTEARAVAERLTAEFTRNHPEAFIPGVTTIRARGGVREVTTHEPARFTDQTWTPGAGRPAGTQVWAANHELTHEALIAFHAEALRIARADAGHLKDGVPQHWADPVAIAKKLFTTNTGYGVQLTRGWLTNDGIPTSKTQYLIGQANLLAGPGSPAANAAAAGNTAHPHVHERWLHHQNITAAIHGRTPTDNERHFVFGWSEATHQKNPKSGAPLNTTPDGITRQAEIHRAQALAWKALISGTPLSLETISDKAKNLGITQDLGTGNQTRSQTHLVDRAKGWLAAVGLYSTNSSVKHVWPSGRTLLTEAIITQAGTILAQQPVSSIMGLIPSQLTSRIADAILAHPPGITTPVTLDTAPDGSSPDRANFEAFITAVLQSSSTRPSTDPGTVADLTHVLNQAWAHTGEITERDIKTFAINRFGDDSPAILHTVNGWLYGAGVLGNPPRPGTPGHTRIHHAATNAAATTVTGATPDYTIATRQIHPAPAPYTVAVTTRAIHANWPPTTTTTAASTTTASTSTATASTSTATASTSTATASTSSTAATAGTGPGGVVGPTVESGFGGAVWEHTTGMSSSPSLTPRARAWFKTQALQLATDALARPRPDGTVPGWVEVSELTDQLFSTNKAYGAALVTAWMTTHNIPTSLSEKHIKLTREAVTAGFTGNTNYGTVNGKPQPVGIARHVYGPTQRATTHEEKQTQGRVQYQVVAHGVTELKNTLEPGFEAKIAAVVQRARKAILTNQKVTITDASGPFMPGTTASQPGVQTVPAANVERRVRGILESGRLYHTKEDTPYGRPGMEWSGIVHDTITAASKHLDVNPNSDDAALIGAATAQIVADTGLADPADPAAATHLTALLTGALEGAGLTTPTLANHPNAYLGVQLNAVLTHAKDHGPLTDQDIKTLAQQEFATITTITTPVAPADLAVFTWQVRGWLHGAGLHGAPHPEQPPHPLATRAAQLADQLTARNLPYTPAQIAAGLFSHLPAVTDHHRDVTATWIDQYTQSHTPPTNTAASTLDTNITPPTKPTAARRLAARASLTTWKRDQPQPTTSTTTATAASTATASTSSTATASAASSSTATAGGGTAGTVRATTGTAAPSIGAWPSAVTPDVDPVTGLTPAQRSTLDDLSLRTTPAGGATADTFYNALLTATPEQLRNATTPGEIRRHLATQAVLDFHTDPAIAARITHAGGLDTVLTHLRDGTDATTATGALVPDLAARHYEFPIDIIDANGDVMPGAGRPRQVTANTVNSTTIALTHTLKPHTTTGTYDHFLPTTADDLLNAFLDPDSSTGRNRRRREESRNPSEERDRRGWAPGNDGWPNTLFGSVPVADTTASPAAGKNPVQTTILNENTPTPARTSPTISTPAVTTPTNDAADGRPRRSSILDALAGLTTPATATTPTAALGMGVVAADTPDAARRVEKRFPWLKTVNPYYKTGTKYTRVEFETNCILAAITVDISITEGEGFIAPPSAATTIDDLINNTGHRPVPTTYHDIATHLLNSPPGTRGYLAIETKPGTGRRTIDGQTVDGHVVNVIHAVDGNVYFLDGQTGGPAHLPDNPTKVEYIPTTTTDTLATPAVPPSTPLPAPAPVLSAGSESAPVTGPARGDVLFGESRAPTARGTSGAAVTVDDTARFGKEKERSGDPGGPSNTTAGLTASSNGMGKGKGPAGVGDLSTAHTTGDDQADRVETAEPGRLEERFRAEFGRHFDVPSLLKDASALLPRIPMVIPDRSPELTAAYAAVQDTKFQVAKLLHAGKDTEAQAEAERLTTEFTRNHPEAFIPGVTTIRARGGVREVTTHEPARFTDQTWTPGANRRPGVQVWAANHELTHQALIAFHAEALRIARLDAAHQTNGIPHHWADPVAIAKKLFTTNTGYGVQLTRGWLTNDGIPTSKTQYEIGQLNLLAGPGSPAVNAAAAGNRAHPHVRGAWLHHKNITAAMHGGTPTSSERNFVFGWSEATHQKDPYNSAPLNTTPDGITRQAEIHRAQALVWKALITGTPLNLTTITDTVKGLGITPSPGTGTRTTPQTNLHDRTKGWLAAVGLYPTGSTVSHVWPSGRTLLTDAIITHADTILAQQPASSIMRLTPSQLTSQVADAILARPPGITTPITLDTKPDGSSPDRANFETFITAVLQSSSTRPLTDAVTAAQLTHVLNQAWAHPGEITERDVKTFAITTFADDSPAILHTVNGWLYGAGILGNPPAPGTPRHTRIHHAATNAAATTVTGATPNYTAATHQIHPNPAPYTVAVTTSAIHANWPPTPAPATASTTATASTSTAATVSTAAMGGANAGGPVNPTFEDTFTGPVWDTTTGTAPSPHLTPQARAQFKTQALRLANNTGRGWAEVNELTNQLFSTNKAYGAALVTVWMTTHNIPISEQEKNLKLTREAINAAFTGNTNYGTISGKPQPAGIARHVYGLTRQATTHEKELTNGRVQYQVVAHGVTELKNTLQPGGEAKVTAVIRLAREAILTNQKVTIQNASGPFMSGTTANQPGMQTTPAAHIERQVRALLESGRLSYKTEDEKYARPGMEWSGIIHDTLTAASKHLDTNPNSDDATLITAATAQIVADTGLSDPADPAAATHLTALLTGALEGAGLTTPTLANHPNTYVGVQLNAVLTYAKDHGPLTDQDIKTLAQQEFATITTITTPADLAAFTWQVRGWLHGAGLHGAPHPEQPPHPLATRAAQLADQLTARNLPYTPAQIAAGLFPRLPAVTDHHRDLTATWIDQYTQSHTPPTNTVPSTLDTTGRQIVARATLTTWKHDQPQPTTSSTATAASSGTATASAATATAGGGTGVTVRVTTGMTASTIPPWPTATTPDIDPVTGLTPAQRSTLDDLSLRTTPAGGATADTFYTALLTTTPEQLRNATTPGEIRQHLAAQAILDFHTDPAIAARITHAGGLDTVLTHLRDGTDATTATGALIPDLTARHYNIPITIIDTNGDPIPGTGQPRHPTHNPFTTPVILTHTRQPHTTTTGTGGSGSGSYDHFLPTTTADDDIFLNLNSNNSGRNNTRRREESRDPSPQPPRRGWAPGTDSWPNTLFGSGPGADQ